MCVLSNIWDIDSKCSFIEMSFFLHFKNLLKILNSYCPNHTSAFIDVPIFYPKVYAAQKSCWAHCAMCTGNYPAQPFVSATCNRSSRWRRTLQMDPDPKWIVYIVSVPVSLTVCPYHSIPPIIIRSSLAACVRSVGRQAKN